MFLKEIEIDEFVVGNNENYRKQSFIVEEGNPFRGLFYIRKGIVKILKKDSKGKNLLMCFITKGDMIGITTFFNDDIYKFSAMAMSDCELLFISPEEYKSLLKKSNVLNKKMMEILVQRINFLENWMTNVLNLSVQNRLAESLIYYTLSNGNLKDDPSKNNDILINYSIDELAGITGSTNGYITKLLHQFSKKKLIERVNSRELKISNYSGLIEIANTTSPEV